MHQIKTKRFFTFALSIVMVLSCVIFQDTAVLADEAYRETQLVVTKDYQTVDTFCGVPAKYIKGYSDTGDYCCAAYVSNFYEKLFGVTVYNINMVDDKPSVYCWGKNPVLKTVSNPKPGDIMQTKDYTHVAIVKAVDGDEITLIEQNYKWKYDDKIYTIINRKILKKNYYFYRLYLDGKEQTVTKSMIQSGSGNQQLQSVNSSPAEISLDKDYVTVQKGKSATIKASLSDSKKEKITWKSADTSIAKVSGGKITGVNAGQTTITAITENGREAFCTVTVTDNISNAKISVSSCSYTGKVCTPNVKITYAGRTLEKGKDYKVTSKSSAIGKGKATITGIECFKGKKTVTFTIKPAKPSDVKVLKKNSNVSLSWKKVKGAQGYIVKAYNSKTKKWARIYKGKSVSLKKKTSAEKFEVIAYKVVKNKGYYSQPAKVSTESKSASTTASVKKPEQAYFVGAKINNGKITFILHAQNDISGREIYMSDSENGKYKKVLTTSTETSASITEKMYTLKYFKVRAFRNTDGGKVYSDFSDPMAVWVC